MVIGQINSCCDRCSTLPLLVKSLTFLFLEFAVVGYPFCVLADAASSFFKSHPYLAETKMALNHAYQLLSLLRLSSP